MNKPKVRYSYLEEKFGDTELRRRVFERFGALLDKGDFTLGAAVAEFEHRFAELVGAKYAIGVANGTDALRLALKAIGVGPGDEVITGASSFIASAGAIVELGATPVFVEMDNWFTMDVDYVEAAITEKTKAILPVHFTGEPVEMDKLMKISQKYQIPIVEDCAQAVLAEYRGTKCGNFGRMGCFSLHPLKNLNVFGDGGMIVTNDFALDQQLRLMRNHGLVDRDTVELLGCNSRLDTLQAHVGLELIGKTPSDVEQRRLNAAYYDMHLEQVPNLALPIRRRHVKSCFHLYMFYVAIKQTGPTHRNDLVKYLNERGVEAKIHYPVPMYRQPCFPSDGPGFRHADWSADHIVTLPCDEHLTKTQQDYAIRCIREFLG